ncbi:MAG: DNA mismatch repair endonuclease MutL [Oscillospiraceae bacterium]|nr:DNA mismatch repair endonuclease MutL [Oscillospiraceae bacterium]
MSVINILPPHVADLIAAGEVVERPASVIKELMENAFDAGAQNVTVELRGGGATYIRVTDDGCGMAPEDAGVAFLRHATSKLRDERGLEAIGTMGFRGEALAAISAVSHIELRTRRREDEAGTLVTLSAGDIQEMGPTGCPAGTTMIVRDLFYNTPARLKFLKSDRSESAACVQAALRCALGRPEVSVRLIRDGNEEFFSPGDGRAESCVYALLGRDLASTLLPCRGEDEGMRVSGFVTSPSAGRGSRGAQYFFCNGRFIKSQLLQAALEQAYKNTLLTGRYPGCVLYLDLSLGSVDVNVHPAKTEVKFSYERRVFDLVYHAALSALQGEDRLTEQPAASAPKPTPAPATRSEAPQKPDFFRSMSAEAFRAARRGPEPWESGSAMRLHAPEYQEQTRLDLTPPPVSASSAPKSLETTGFAPSSGPKAVENSVQNVESAPIPDHKILGEALKTYILVDLGEQLLLIDKHAAHERMNFDRLKAMDRQILSQTLLAPVTLRPDPGDCELLEQNGELLSELGFEIEPFGPGAYLLRAVPADILPGDGAPALEEILEKLRRGKAPDPAAARDELLHTVACKAAIKAGWDTGRQELERIVEEVLSGRVKYCPHGRPVSAVLSKKDLEKMFKRIV